MSSVEQASDVDLAIIAQARSEWGACLLQLGRLAEAEEPLLQAYRTFRPSGEAPATVLARTALRHLIELYRAQDRPEEAAKYRRLLEKRR